MFQGGQQHDSQELLLLLIDCIVDSMSHPASPVSLPKVAEGGRRAAAAAASPLSLAPSSPCADIFAGATCGMTPKFITAFLCRMTFLKALSRATAAATGAT
jgi:hypothetical protein